MSFPVPIEYALNDKKDNTILKYNNGDEWEGLPSPPEAGGITPIGTKQISITENGTITEDVTNYANAEITVNVGGGVASNVVQGSFTLAENGAHDIDIPYTGYGYIIAFLAVVKDGREDGSWASLVQKNALEAWGAYKLYPNVAPTYEGQSSNANGGSRFSVFKLYSDSANYYSSSASTNQILYSDTDSTPLENTSVTFRGKNKISVYGADSGHGFALNIEYNYIAVYSE